MIMRKYYVMLFVAYTLWAVACWWYAREAYGSDADKTSWEVYCEKYGVDKDNPTSEQETYYLDCYVGSTEEEEDMQ